MTTKEYLEQIMKYDLMIQNKIAEISQLRGMACNVSVKSDKDRIQSSSEKDKIGNMVVKIVDVENAVTGIVEKRKRIIDQIESISDADMYDVLAKRYILGKMIKVIACERKEDKIQTLRHLDKAIDVFEEKFGSDYIPVK